MTFKVGDCVIVPPDRGAPGGPGVVTHVGSTVAHNHQGVPYTWVTVKDPWQRSSVWPSNRLSKRSLTVSGK